MSNEPQMGQALPGTATKPAGSHAAPIMEADGECLRRTIANLEDGVGSKPMPREALDATTAQAKRVLCTILQAYANGIGPGEIGADGAARKLDENSVDVGPTGLLYGRVQSGKTLGMTLLSALALDNGFRLILVFTSNFVKLVEQTKDRFGAVDGPLIHASTESGEWDLEKEHVKKFMGPHGLVLVCAKDPNHIKKLRTFLEEIGADRFPALILDDEADQATPDTSVRARSKGKDVDPSAIHKSILGGEEYDSIRALLRHSVFLQVTATPYSLLLQNIDSPSRPSFAELLEPGKGYTGGESFFSEELIKDQEGGPPLSYVSDDETTKLDSHPDEVPVGLARAISYFLISASAQYELDKASRRSGQNFLCHTSYKKGEHDKLATLIRKYLEEVVHALEDSAKNEALHRLEWAYEELGRSLSERPPLTQLLDSLRMRLHRRKVHTVNSSGSEVDFVRELTFLVGGNILGRGLTIDNLLVTYYIRRAKTTQMDTMLQHARMFGYRTKLMPYTRVFLPRALALRFHLIHTSEAGLRKLLADAGSADHVPVEVPAGLRATRPGVLDVNQVSSYRPAQQVFPHVPVYRQKDLSTSYTKKLEKLIEAAFGGTLSWNDFHEVELDAILDIVRAMKTDVGHPGSWDKDVLEAVLTARQKVESRGIVFARKMDRTGSDFFLATGAMSGPELSTSRAFNKPVLALFKQEGVPGKWDGVPFWYPTIVLPGSMSTQVFNTSA